jgi:hypothetical protein
MKKLKTKKAKASRSETTEEIIGRLENELPDGFRIINMADSIDFGAWSDEQPEPKQLPPPLTTNDTKDAKTEGHKPFGGMGMYEASRQALGCIATLRYVASAKHFDNDPSFAKMRFDASKLLAEVAALFIQRWPSQVHVPPGIWEIHRDKKSGFRQRWDSIRKSTKQNDAFVDDFAYYTVWAFGWLDEPKQMRQYQADPETCWTKVLEPRGRKYWPNWISEENINRYYPKEEDRYEALKVTGWTKGKWNAKVKTATMKIAAEWEISALWFELPSG